MKIIYKSAGILIQNRKILVEKSFGKTLYIAPGGKIDIGESPEQALIRELQEEFQIHVEEKDLEYFATYEAAAAGQEDVMVSMIVYFVHKWVGAITPSNEVEHSIWINSNIPDTIQVGSIFAHEVIPKLNAMHLID